MCVNLRAGSHGFDPGTGRVATGTLAGQFCGLAQGLTPDTKPGGKMFLKPSQSKLIIIVMSLLRKNH